MDFVVNTVNGRPLLELLLARDAIETPTLPVEQSRAAFQDFLAIPAQGEDGGACFQTELVAEGDSGAVFGAGLFRQVTDFVGAYDPLEPRTRLIGIWWRFELSDPGALESIEIWASDCASLDEFWACVDATREWQFLTDRSLQEAGVVADEDEYFGHTRRS